MRRVCLNRGVSVGGGSGYNAGAPPLEAVGRTYGYRPWLGAHPTGNASWLQAVLHRFYYSSINGRYRFQCAASACNCSGVAPEATLFPPFPCLRTALARNRQA